MVNNKELAALQGHYEESMRLSREWGLNPFEIDFHVVPPAKMYEIASYGIPGHYSHWSYGRDFWRQKSSYDYGRSKIYELIINSDPAQAFLLENNSLLENQFVISHCLFHSDFFARSALFSHTNRKMLNTVAAAADRFREYELDHGRFVVEEFIDDVNTISMYIDPLLHTKKKTKDYETVITEHEFIDLFPDDEELVRAEELENKNRKLHKFPYEPEKDLLKFIADNGRLQDWQRDIILTMREEMIYFLPQLRTKFGNEGFASVGHRCLMSQIDPESDPGGIEFAQIHSSVLSPHPGSLNPYFLGYKILMRIIQIFGEHSDQEMDRFEFINGPGWQKMLEVIELESDEGLVRNYLDEKLCEELDLFAFAFDEEDKVWSITDKDWEKVRDILVNTKINFGIPSIIVEDGDFRTSSHLYLKHEHDGRPLNEKFAFKTLEAVERLWGRPVLIETSDETGKDLWFTCTEGQTARITGKDFL